MRIGLRWVVVGLWVAGGVGFCAVGSRDVWAQKPRPYPAMAPLAQYMEPSAAEEAALARTAAPPSISDDAGVMVLGAHGYEQVTAGKNGFVCVVQRAWAAEPGWSEFWSTKNRSPICFNAAAVRSVLPEYLERTQWVLAGVSEDEIVARTKAALAAKTLTAPEPGAMAYMMSKRQYLNDEAIHWHPHLMFFVPQTEEATWGANLAASPVMGTQSKVDSTTVFFVPVMAWSDGSPAPAM